MNINNIKNNKSLTTAKAGFTLIELLVATTIFTSIMVVAMGALMVTLSSARHVRALNVAMDNVNFTMESITRSIRMGSGYSNSDDNISFTSSRGKSIQYNLEDRNDGTKKIMRCEGTDCIDLVSPEVNIESLYFNIKGNSISDGLQPSVYVTVKGIVTIKEATSKEVKASFSLQTLVSQRNPEE